MKILDLKNFPGRPLPSSPTNDASDLKIKRKKKKIHEILMTKQINFKCILW